jgi:hypothetical protein
MIYALKTVMGPIAYFKHMPNAVAFWNYLQMGEGAPHAMALGINPEDIEMIYIRLTDVDDEEFMEFIHESTKRSSEQRRMNELGLSLETIPSRADQE